MSEKPKERQDIERPEAGIRVVTAGNPGAMTHTGTQTYIVGEGRVAVIDPGPDNPEHMEAVLAALGPTESISHILVTHSHLDHSPMAGPLAKRTGAPVLAFGDSTAGRSATMHRFAGQGTLGGGEGVDTGFRPRARLAHGDLVTGDGWQLRALHTPGHMGNHLCFAWEQTGALFSGDHVMGWASTMVSPPDGDVSAFMASLTQLRGRSDQVYFPGHGPAVADPMKKLDQLFLHRKNREAQILESLGKRDYTIRDLTHRLYSDIDTRLLPAAARNVLAHLIDLIDRDIVSMDGTEPLSASFQKRKT